MTARQALNATYVYLCGLLGEEKVDALLEGDDGAVDAVANRSGVEALEALARMPRFAGARR